MAKPLAVITGASSGIGRAFARRLAPHYELLLVARREERLAALARELMSETGTTAHILAADLSVPAEQERVAGRISAEPSLELLVNNAGFGYRGAFWEANLDLLEKMHRLHVMATVRLTHAALRVLVARNHGAVINLGSVAAFAQRACIASYGATKSWTTAFTEGLYLDLRKAKSAVTVQALCPGFTHSGFYESMGEERRTFAPESFWMTPEAVVTESLKALSTGKLIVIPGWRYKMIVAVLTKLPNWLKLRLEAPLRSRAP